MGKSSHRSGDAVIFGNNNCISFKTINHHRPRTGTIWCCYRILTVQNTFFFQKGKKEGIVHLFPFPTSFSFASEVMSKMMHNIYNYAHDTEVSIKYLSTIFIFSGDYLN